MRFPQSHPRSLLALLLLLIMAGCDTTDPLAGARDLQTHGDVTGSMRPLREALSRDPESAEAQYLYGRALAQTGQIALSEWWLRSAMDDPEYRTAAGYLLARGALVAGNHRTAIEATTRILDSEPEDVDALLLRAHALAAARRDLDAALADAERVLALDPERIEAFEPKILALLGLERVDDAASAIEALGARIDRGPATPALQGWHCATTALFAEESGELDTARARWSSCLSRHPTHSDVVAGAIAFHDARSETERSLDVLREALASRPSSRDLRWTLAERLRAVGQANEAEDLLLEGTRFPATAIEAWSDLAKHHQMRGEFGAAAKAAKRAVELAREESVPEAQLLLDYADSLLLSGDHEGARAVADEMSLPAHRAVIRARVAQQSGRPAEALEHFEESFRLWPNNPWSRYYAALAAEAIGDSERAVEAYRYSIRIAAGATDARFRLARLHQREGRPAEALAILGIRSVEAPLGPAGEALRREILAGSGEYEPADRRTGGPDATATGAVNAPRAESKAEFETTTP